MVAIIYWTLIFPVSLAYAPDGYRPNFNVYAKHGIPFLCMLVEFFGNKMAVEWNHWVGIVFMGLNYNILVILYTLT
jgi:hypothetical protein